jgi:O-antigen ligase
LNINLCQYNDLYFSILGLLILVSATAIFALIVGIFIAIILSQHKIKYLFVSLFFLLISFLILIFFFGDSEYYRLTFGFLEYSGNIVDLFNNIMFRSGTRVIRFLWGWDAFLSHPFTGIGFGADQKYTEIASIPEIAQMYVTPWDSAWGNPFVNPFIEALGTMGIFGFISLLYSFYLLIYLYKKSKRIIYFEAQYVLAIIVGIISLITTLQMEGTFLRYYLWSSYAIAWGMVARLNDINNNNPNT